MKWDGYIDEHEIRKTIAMLKDDDQLFEIRIISGDKKRKLSGYFKDVDSLLREFERVDVRDANIYMTLNFIKEDCYSRMQNNRFINSAQTTSDSDIYGYQWMLVDLDPVRPTGISSSAEEVQAAVDLAKKVYQYLKNLGFEEPIKAMSGNGCHLLYRVALNNNEENAKLVQNCLKALSELFSTDQVAIDTVNYNPSRICKLHGTLAQKGANTEARPHRMSRIFSGTFDAKPTDIEYLKKLADEIPADPKPTERQYQRHEFDLLDFMSRNGMSYRSQRDGNGCSIYMLDECPFDHSHKDGDARVFHYTNGAIAFKCHHNSCSGKKWQDVRMLFEPDAYDHTEIDQRIEEGWKEHNRLKAEGEIPYTEEQKEEVFRNARQIMGDDEPDHEFVLTGINKIDEEMHGLEKTCITVISGLRGGGKSTVIGQIMLSAINSGSNVVCYSGELANKKYLKWLIRQAAGKSNVVVSTKYKNGYGVPDETSDKIVDWLGDHFWLYDNRCGNNFKRIEMFLREELKRRKADLCVIDNLMALDLSEYSSKDKYDAQTKFVWALKNLAMLTNTHIIFVAHPRKAESFLRLDDISGTGNIANIVDNAFIVHRNNIDFQRKTQEMLGWKESDEIYNASNVVEIAKDREGGLQDVFIPLFFEEQTKRLKNSKSENVVYGWDTEEDEFSGVEEEIPF